MNAKALIDAWKAGENVDAIAPRRTRFARPLSVQKGALAILLLKYYAEKNYQTTRIVEALNLLPCHWQIIPTNGKKPLGCQWQQRPFTPKALQQQLAKEGRVKVCGNNQTCYEAVPTGIALLCGQNEREFLIAVDCDGQSAYDKIEQIAPTPLPSTVAFTSGRTGRAQYLFKIPNLTKKQLKSRKIRTATHEALELRAANLASVLPPSIHPTTGHYCWLPGCRPDETEVAVAPDWIIEQISVPTKARSPSPESSKSERLTATSTMNLATKERAGLFIGNAWEVGFSQGDLKPCPLFSSRLNNSELAKALLLLTGA